MEVLRPYIEQLIQENISSLKSKIISHKKYDEIVSFLRDPETCSRAGDRSFQRWVLKEKKFQLKSFPKQSLKDVLVVPKDDIACSGNSKKKGRDISNFLRVVHSGDFFDTLCHIHETDLNHAGYKKVLKFCQQHYYGITRGIIQEFTRRCPVCKSAAPPVLKPLRAVPGIKPALPEETDGFLHRVQVDLIDMNHAPDGDFHYIGHVMDYYSHYHILFPLKSKSADEVAFALERYVFAYFGIPRFFHSGNGREFLNTLLMALLDKWEGKVCLMRGKEGNSLSLGLVERANTNIQTKIAAMGLEEKRDQSSYPWSSWLPRIMYAMNTEESESTKMQPYTVVFGQPPKSLDTVTTVVFDDNAEPAIQKQDCDMDDSTTESNLQVGSLSSAPESSMPQDEPGSPANSTANDTFNRSMPSRKRPRTEERHSSNGINTSVNRSSPGRKTPRKRGVKHANISGYSQQQDNEKINQSDCKIESANDSEDNEESNQPDCKVDCANDSEDNEESNQPDCKVHCEELLVGLDEVVVTVQSTGSSEEVQEDDDSNQESLVGVDQSYLSSNTEKIHSIIRIVRV